MMSSAKIDRKGIIEEIEKNESSMPGEEPKQTKTSDVDNATMSTSVNGQRHAIRQRLVTDMEENLIEQLLAKHESRLDTNGHYSSRCCIFV